MDSVLKKKKKKSTLSRCCEGLQKLATAPSLWAIVFINASFILLLSVLVGLLQSQTNTSLEHKCSSVPDQGAVHDTERYCFRMEKLECVERGYALKSTVNGTVCCGKLDTHIFSLLSEKVAENLQSDAAKDSDAPRIHWEQASQTSFVTGGLVHAGDRLRVTTAGYYYVYTGLQFEVDPKTVESGAIVAYIYRHVNGTRASRRKLMMARESSCKQTRDVHGPVSVYMAGVFLLREQDEISVRTHSQSLLNRSPATTYFGMHMV